MVESKPNRVDHNKTKLDSNLFLVDSDLNLSKLEQERGIRYRIGIRHARAKLWKTRWEIPCDKFPRGSLLRNLSIRKLSRERSIIDNLNWVNFYLMVQWARKPVFLFTLPYQSYLIITSQPRDNHVMYKCLGKTSEIRWMRLYVINELYLFQSAKRSIFTIRMNVFVFVPFVLSTQCNEKRKLWYKKFVFS